MVSSLTLRERFLSATESTRSTNFFALPARSFSRCARLASASCSFAGDHGVGDSSVKGRMTGGGDL